MKPIHYLLGGARRLIKAAAGGLSDFLHPTAWLRDNMVGNMPTYAGVDVTPDNSLSVSAFHRGVAYISSQIAMTPGSVFRKSSRGREPLPEHPVSKLLFERANPWMSSMAFRETLTAQAIIHGRGCALIERQDGAPVALWPVPSQRIYPKIVDGVGHDTKELVYIYRPPNGETVGLPPDAVFHVHGLGDDGIDGHSVVRLAARSLGIAIAAEQYSGAFFGNGAWASGVISHPQSLSEQGFKNLRESFRERYQGTENAFKPMILEEGMTWTTASIPPEHAQLLGTQEHLVAEAARFLGLPPHKLFDLRRATFSNITEQNIEVVQDGLMPWFVRFEQEAKLKLLRQPSLYVKHNVTALLRGDPAARATFYRELFNLGVLSPNEIRGLEDMNPIEGESGDVYYIQSNMTTLDLVADPPEPAPAPAPFTTGPEPPTEESGEEDGVAESGTSSRNALAIYGLIEHAAGRVVRREINAVRGPARKHADDARAFSRWANTFYSDQRDYLEAELAPVLALTPGYDRAAYEEWLDGWQAESLKHCCDLFGAECLLAALPAAEGERIETITKNVARAARLEVDDVR